MDENIMLRLSVHKDAAPEQTVRNFASSKLAKAWLSDETVRIVLEDGTTFYTTLTYVKERD